MNQKPNPSEYAAYYEGYINTVPEGSIIDLMFDRSIFHYLGKLSEEDWTLRYAPGKWSIKEVIIHLCDAERVFAYRAMRIARNDKTPLPGFDQNDYIPHYKAKNRSGSEILEEFITVRGATISLFKSFDEEDFKQIGVASGYDFSVLALAYIIVGHSLHHIKIISERYFTAT